MRRAGQASWDCISRSLSFVSSADLDRVIASYVTEACLRRYLRGTAWVLEKAIAQLHETIRWRIEDDPTRPCIKV